MDDGLLVVAISISGSGSGSVSGIGGGSMWIMVCTFIRR